MQVNLHQNARTTPAIRQELRESPLSIAELVSMATRTDPVAANNIDLPRSQGMLVS